MCIGESCLSKCEGLACEARCRGNGCEASCRTFSCNYVINAKYGRGGSTWSDHYPQYDEKNIRNPNPMYE
ncbi:seminal fluid protein HACP043 [Danaus plexippus plexippus]|uniref:Seminal fluid protein HACP043 n=2 Tax=Danaus plexippus TaxID=13037 RepID=A0A212EV57_DANPL|nr:seminal fluid protein HACP043 [Danaus plexippus plexippus]